MPLSGSGYPRDVRPVWFGVGHSRVQAEAGETDRH
jgi:hypothetical protein